MAKASVCLLLSLAAAPVAAQSNFYGGAAVAADGLDRQGHMQVGATPAVGGFLGWRFADSWSAELHLDRAFGKSSPWKFDELLYTEQTLRSEIYGRTVLVESAGAGFSVLAVWKSPPSGRVRAAVTMGLSMRRFDRQRTTTVTRVGPDVTLPPEHRLRQGRNETSQFTSRGLSGGLFVPLTISRGWTIGPEVRLTTGLVDRNIFNQLYAGGRVVRGF
jgi:outer membrane protein with beta-barrel domain